MFRRCGIMLFLLLMLPAFASAWTITAGAGGGGTITPKGTLTITGTTGTSQAFTVTPAAGYDIYKLLVNGVDKGAVANYTVSYDAAKLNQTITAYFKAKTYTITPSAEAGGTIYPSSVQTVNGGGSKSFNVYPNAGSSIADVKVNGVSVGPVTSYTFNNVQANATIAASFTVVKAEAGGNRTIVAKGLAATPSVPYTVNLSGSASTGASTYAWQLLAKPSSSAAVLSNAAIINPSFVADVSGEYQVKLTVANGSITSSDTIVVNVAVNPEEASAKCIGCHSSSTSGASLVNAWKASTHNTGTYSYAGCQGCHVGSDNTMTGTLITSSNFINVCENCHTPGAVYGIRNADLSGKAPHYNPVVADFSNPAFANMTAVGVRDASYLTSRINQCSICHSTHNNQINAEYAESAHGDIKGAAWTHYDFKTRATCVRCHTTTGFVAWSSAKVVTPWGSASDKTLEVLTCNGCHKDTGTGELRPLGRYTETYADGATFTFPEVGASNICLNCHSAREAGSTIKASTANFTNVSFINSHYLSAGGTVFSVTGYEFDGRTYDLPTGHKNAGVGNTNETGDNGPCVACHMSAGFGHSFMPVRKDESTGAILELTSTTCAKCHTDMSVAKLEETKSEVDAALEALNAMLASKGIYFYNASPYFFTAPYVVGGTNNPLKNWTVVGVTGLSNGKNNMGAAFNYNLIAHEPGAYAHNKGYALRLIADSIDYLDNGALDNTAAAAINNLTLSPAVKAAAVSAITPVTVAAKVELGDPAIAAANGYVGSTTCQGCHSEQFAGWSNTLHNKPLKTVAGLGDSIMVNDGGSNATANSVNDFIEGLNFNTATFAGYANPFASQAAVGNAPILSSDLDGSNKRHYYIQIGTTKYEVQRTQGGNIKWKQRYHTKIGNAYYVLPVQYNEVTKRYSAYTNTNWYNGTTPLFNQTYGSQALVDAVAESLINTTAAFGGTSGGSASSSWDNRCAGCHQTGLTTEFKVIAPNTKAEVVAGYSELNVGCEACHGAGATHAASLNRNDIINPARLIDGSAAGLQRAQEVCGTCHQRGEGKAQLSDPGFGTVKLHVEAPSENFTPSVAMFPKPGERLLDFMEKDLTNTKIWDSVKTLFTPYDGTTTFFPSYTASSGHHQQWEDMEQGPKRTEGQASWAKMTCFMCHDPHSANSSNIKTSIKKTVGSSTLTIPTNADDNTLCLACHAGYGDFASLTKQDIIDTPTSGPVPAAVMVHMDAKVPGKIVDPANYLLPVRKDGAPATYGRITYKVGQCLSCHMPAMPSSSGVYAYLDKQGRKQGDQRSHSFKTIWASSKDAVAAGAPAGSPTSCTGCHAAND